MCLSTLIIAALWVLLYQINHWALESFEITRFVSWIFLPAAIRMLAIIVCEWIGAVGLFVGALVTNQMTHSISIIDGLTLASLSSVGPLLAFWCCTRLLSLPVDLLGLSAKQLLAFSVVGALFNAVPLNIYFYCTDRTNGPFESLVPTFLGDLSGTLVVLFVASLAMRLIFKRPTETKTLR